ncbi:hypothetical protein, partial [Streptomyces sp. CC216C]|uniref:hypothetical protein n=1 Tax=Streptomyces sp. CC216C TaxID=3044576 RepID=UPI0024A8E43F
RGADADGTAPAPRRPPAPHHAFRRPPSLPLVSSPTQEVPMRTPFRSRRTVLTGGAAALVLTP